VLPRDTLRRDVPVVAILDHHQDLSLEINSELTPVIVLIIPDYARRWNEDR
jgi:negative regulator of sigma E activity